MDGWYRPKEIIGREMILLENSTVADDIYSARADDLSSMATNYHPQWLIIIPSGRL
jgi:hypothetical protein